MNSVLASASCDQVTKDIIAMVKIVLFVMSMCVMSFGLTRREQGSCNTYSYKINCNGSVTKILNEGYISKNIRHVTTLKISDSDITDLKSAWTKHAKNVTRLIIYFNKDLNKLSHDSFSHLVNLETLDLSHNNISYIDVAAFFQLINLTTLRLEYNQLRTLETGIFSRQQHLKVLNLSHNKIGILDSLVLNPLMNLEELYINNNEIKTLDARCFVYLEKLRTLNLDRNHLETLPERVFNYQKKLEKLNLNHNNFTALNIKDMSYLHRMTNFTINGNMITTFDFSVLKDYADLQSLDFSGNPIKCDCSAKSFYEWSSKRSIEFNLFCMIKETDKYEYVNASEYLRKMDCSSVDPPKITLLIIIVLLFILVLVDIIVSWINYKYDLTVHRVGSSESVNEYEYVDNFHYLEAKIRERSGTRNSGRYQSVLQKVMSVYDYLRPLPGRREQENTSTCKPIPSNPTMPSYCAPPVPCH